MSLPLEQTQAELPQTAEQRKVGHLQRADAGFADRVVELGLDPRGDLAEVGLSLPHIRRVVKS